MRRGTPPDHILLSGSPGLGKTTWPRSSRPSWAPALRITSGPAIERSGDLAAVLTSLRHGDVLFIDEIHRIARPAEELLYSAMEDFRVDVVVGKGPGRHRDPARRRAVHAGRRDHPGRAADRADARPVRLRRRTWTSTSRPSWTCCCTARPRILGVPITAEGAAEIAGRSRGTPRIANRLLRRVRDFAEVRADGVVTRDDGPAALTRLRRRRARPGPARPGGAERAGRSFGGGPVGLSTLAVAVGEQPDTVEEVCEPFLVRAGLLARTPRGRVATAAAWRHLRLARRRRTRSAEAPPALFGLSG